MNTLERRRRIVAECQAGMLADALAAMRTGAPVRLAPGGGLKQYRTRTIQVTPSDWDGVSAAPPVQILSLDENRESAILYALTIGSALRRERIQILGAPNLATGAVLPEFTTITTHCTGPLWAIPIPGDEPAYTAVGIIETMTELKA